MLAPLPEALMFVPAPRTLTVVMLAIGTALTAAGKASAQEASATRVTLPDPIPMGTTQGERYERLILKNAVVVSGRGTPRSNRAMPPEGPIDIVIENGRIVDMVPVDPVNAAGYGANAGEAGAGHIIDVSGMYVMPGLVDMHVHLRGNDGPLGPRALDYQYRLWMGHGVTTIRDAGTGASLDVMTEQRALSETHDIVAPRLVLCQRWPLPLRRWDVGNTPERAREMVRSFHEQGADCVKISKSPGHYPDVLAAAVDEGRTLGMQVMVDLKVSETDAVTASQAGVASIEHWYGVPDAALPHTQDFPEEYNYWEELDRFRWAGALWAEANAYPERLSAVLDTLIANGTAWNPTMVVYEDNRDLARVLTLPWQVAFYHPSVIDQMWPDPERHGAYHTEWKTSDEIRWKENFRIWMDWVDEFHERGGKLTVGTDTSPWGGLAMVREMELFQEAGLHPIDIIRTATVNAYEVLGMEEHCGIRVGCAADLAVVNGNPIDNLKVMYGLGFGFFGIVPPDEQWQHGGIRWTIKDGVVYDAPALLREVLWYVQQEGAGSVTDGR
jgi:imidazolonepropionase-like amidohydrolase